MPAHGSWESHLGDFTDLRYAVLSGKSPKQRRKAYADLEAGKLDVVVVTPGTVAERWRGVIGKKGTLDDLHAKLTDAPIGTQMCVTEAPPKASAIYTRTANGWRQPDGTELTPDELVADQRNLAAAYADAMRAGYHRTKPPPTPKWLPPDGDVAILQDFMHRMGADTMRVADEIHKFKNPNGVGSRGFWRVMTTPDGPMVAMTGTPKPNGPEDFFHIVNQVKPGLLGRNFDEFADAYCYVVGDRVIGFRPEKLGDLYQATAGVIMARTTADRDVEVHLPKRIDLAPRIPQDTVQEKMTAELVRCMELAAQARVEEAMLRHRPMGGMSPARMELTHLASDDNTDPISRTAARATPFNHQVALLRMTQIAIDPSLLDEDFARDMPDYESPKLAAIADATIEHLQQGDNDAAAVLFSEYNGGLRAMRRALVRRGIDPKHIGFYHGGVTPKKRRALEHGLNTGTYKVLLGNTAALETGANLQKRANFVAHLNTPWAPDRLAQSTARVYRQGQEKPVTVFRPTGSHVEELIERAVSRKLLQSAQATGATMEADDAIARSARAPGKAALTREAVAEVLGIDPKVFMPAKGTVLSPEQIIAKLEAESFEELQKGGAWH